MMTSEEIRQVPTRRIRPVERQPMREWLTDLLDSKEVASLTWLNKSKGEFSIKWCHGSRHGWSMKDADLFERWAVHTGRYLFGGKKDPKRWKANFRCALNSLRNVEEIRDKSVAKGSNAARIYRMKEAVKKDRASNGSQRSQKICQRNNSRVFTKKVSSESEEYWTSGSEAMEEETVAFKPELHVQTPNIFSQVKPEVTNLLPNFDKISPGIDNIEFGKRYSLPRHSSVFSVSLGTSQPVDHSNSNSLANIKISLPESFTRQLSNNLTPQTVQIQDNTPIVFPKPHDNRQIVYPESPEASSGSPESIMKEEEMVELGVYEVSEEVVISSSTTDNTANTFITLDNWTSGVEASSTMVNLISQETTPSCVNTWMHGYVPLTPP